MTQLAALNSSNFSSPTIKFNSLFDQHRLENMDNEKTILVTPPLNESQLVVMHCVFLLPLVLLVCLYLVVFLNRKEDTIQVQVSRSTSKCKSKSTAARSATCKASKVFSVSTVSKVWWPKLISYLCYLTMITVVKGSNSSPDGNSVPLRSTLSKYRSLQGGNRGDIYDSDPFQCTMGTYYKCVKVGNDIHASCTGTCPACPEGQFQKAGRLLLTFFFFFFFLIGGNLYIFYYS